MNTENYNRGTPEWHVCMTSLTERIELTDDEVEILAADLEEAAIIMAEEYPTLTQVCKEWYRSIGKGNLRSYVDALKVQERVKFNTTPETTVVADGNRPEDKSGAVGLPSMDIKAIIDLGLPVPEPSLIDIENTMGWLDLADEMWDHLFPDVQDKLIAAYHKANKTGAFLAAFDAWQVHLDRFPSLDDMTFEEGGENQQLYKTMIDARNALRK